jgi:hypothetical protein
MAQLSRAGLARQPLRVGTAQAVFRQLAVDFQQVLLDGRCTGAEETVRLLAMAGCSVAGEHGANGLKPLCCPKAIEMTDTAEGGPRGRPRNCLGRAFAGKAGSSF